MMHYRKISVLGGVAAGSSVLFMFLGLNSIIKFGVKDQVSLRKRNEIRDVYLKIPFPLNFSLYFFNVTNPDEIEAGAKPILNEVGPYKYDETVEKINAVDNEAEDSLTYVPYHTFHFNQEASGNLSDTDYVTIIDPLLVGMVSQVARDSPALLTVLNQAIPHLFYNRKSIYLTAQVKDILFDGVVINCTSTSFGPKAVCSQIKAQVPGLKKGIERHTYLFSVFGSRNGTLGVPVKVSRGIKSSKDLGKVMEVDAKKELNLWSTRECNRFKGNDGWIIPPLLRPEDGIWIYSTDLCRNLKAFFVEDAYLKKLNVRRYEVELGDMTANEEDKCYCPKPNTCLQKGVFDVSKCQGVPLFATLPHFYQADPELLTKVEGLHPDREKHAIMMKIEPLTSTPIQAAKRMQLNLKIAPTDKISLMTSVPEALHPIFWLEETIDLEGPLLKKVQTVFVLLSVVNVTRWLLLTGGLACIGFGGYMYIKSRKTVQITQIHNVKVSPRANESRTSQTPDLSGTNKVESNNETKQHNGSNILTGHEFDRHSENNDVNY